MEKDCSDFGTASPCVTARASKKEEAKAVVSAPAPDRGDFGVVDVLEFVDDIDVIYAVDQLLHK